MAYDFSKEKQQGLCMVDKNSAGEKISVTYIEGANGSESYDIRVMYTDDNGEIKPTKKGVRIPMEQMPTILSKLIQHSGYDASEYDIDESDGIELDDTDIFDDIESELDLESELDMGFEDDDESDVETTEEDAEA